MKLSELKSTRNIKAKRRVGRGAASGKGGTSGRGHKGHKARTGTNLKAHFEGGQQPFTSRIPKLKGFKPIKKARCLNINLGKLSGLEESGTVKKKNLLKKKILRRGYKLKILGDGELEKALTVEADAFSKNAKEGIEKAGGKAVLVKDKKEKTRIKNKKKDK